MLSTSSFHYAYTTEAADTVVEYVRGKDILALDIETYCKTEYREIMAANQQALDPHSGDISIISICGRDSVLYVLDLKLLDAEGYDYSGLIEALQSVGTLVAHRATFELKWLRHKFKVWFRNFQCTLVLARLHSNSTGSKFSRLRGLRLVDLLRDFLDIKITGKGEEQITDWNARPDINMDDLLISRDYASIEWVSKLTYGAGDTVHLIRLHDFLMSVLSEPLPYSPLVPEGATEPPYGLDQGVVAARSRRALVGYSMIEYNGLPVSKEILDGVYEKLMDKEGASGEIMRVAGQLCEYFDLETEESWFDDYKKPSVKSYRALNSPTQLKSLLQRGLQLGVLDTVDSKVIQRLIDLYNGEEFYSTEEADQFAEIKSLENSVTVQYSEVLSLLVKYKQLLKLYQMDLRDYINPLTNCIHGSVNQAAAATGRCIAGGSRVRVVGKLYVPIQEVEVGDLVFCYNKERKLQIRRVLNVFYRGVAPVIRINWLARTPIKTSGSFMCTPEHKVLSQSRGWVEAQKLKMFEPLINLPTQVMGGKTKDSIIELFTNPKFQPEKLMGDYTFTTIQAAQDQQVYDLEVEELNNFICEDICVHNSASASPNTQNISGRTKVTIQRPLNNIFPQGNQL